jgi:hypothetical protein
MDNHHRSDAKDGNQMGFRRPYRALTIVKPTINFFLLSPVYQEIGGN